MGEGLSDDLRKTDRWRTIEIFGKKSEATARAQQLTGQTRIVSDPDRMADHWRGELVLDKWTPNGPSTAPSSYAPAADRQGRPLSPGDRVRFKMHPRGTAEGHVIVSPRTFEVLPDGSSLPALCIAADGGVIYPLHSRGVTKIMSKMKPNGDLVWREAYAREYKEAEREGLDAPSARERASQRAWADYRSRTGQEDYLRNARRPKGKAHEQEFAGYKFTSGPAETVIHRQRIQTESSGDYGADPVGDGTFRMVPSGDVVDFEECNRRLDRFRRNGGDLRDRVADALGWSAEQVRSMSWQSLRELVRPVSQNLAQEITTAIQSGSYALPEHLRPPEQRPNRTGYYVWVIDPVRNWPLDEGPYGPHDLVTAKQLARIGATKGQHDRAVSTSPDPQSRSFEIVRRYEAQTGRRLV